jgi:hypothetical protein
MFINKSFIIKIEVKIFFLSITEVICKVEEIKNKFRCGFGCDFCGVISFLWDAGLDVG